jgi:hypothetical protein
LFGSLGRCRSFFCRYFVSVFCRLTEADHDYLGTQNVERASPLVRGLSPKEQARLHALVNASQTENDPTARTKIVHEALVEFESHQRWEVMNPGQLWDVPKRKVQN